jgi:hypothetical protein
MRAESAPDEGVRSYTDELFRAPSFNPWASIEEYDSAPTSSRKESS